MLYRFLDVSTVKSQFVLSNFVGAKNDDTKNVLGDTSNTQKHCAETTAMRNSKGTLEAMR